MRTPILNNIRRRQKQRQELLDKFLDNRQELSSQSINEVSDIVKEVINKSPDRLGITLEGENTEPLGMARGSIRAIITIWIVLMFCIICMWDFMAGLRLIPIEWFLGIVSLVIGSYFYTRFKVGF